MNKEKLNITTDHSRNQCPAKCKQTGKCYARAYFEGKPGKAMECKPDDCKWIPK